MTLKYIIQVDYESTDYMTDDPEKNWFILREIDEFDDDTIICESRYRHEIERIQKFLTKEQWQLTGAESPPDPESLCKVESHYHEKNYEFPIDCDYKL